MPKLNMVKALNLALFQAMERGIKSVLIEYQNFVRDLPDPLCDGPAVHRSRCYGLQDQQVYGALNKISRLAHLPSFNDKSVCSF